MRTAAAAILFILWMILTCILTLSFVGLIVIMCDDNQVWLSYGKTLLAFITKT